MASAETHLEKYLHDLLEIRSSGEATDETSYYPPLNSLLNSVGGELKPKVHCILTIKNRGAGQPDGGLFTKDQFQRIKDERLIPGQKPARGAIEAKPTKDDAFVTAASGQVSRYWREYGQVLVTNYRDFVLIGRDAEGAPVKLGSYRLAADEKTFWQSAGHPQKTAKQHGSRFVDFLKLALLSPAVLVAPKDVAWVLAYYAREAKARIEIQAELPALGNIRTALEQALGLKFEGEKGEHFFRSSLVQTLFYGIFSAWVLWSKQQGSKQEGHKKMGVPHFSPPLREVGAAAAKFDWRLAQWSLRVPMIRVLFEQVATPGHLGQLDLIEVLDWTASALNRVDRTEFFSRFQEQEAVQYFYEPFLEAFDHELRKELGVWYTPTEIVKYMVARTHKVLREELNLEDGLADPNVYVLDPGCGTGAYLVEVLKTVAATLAAKGSDALAAQDVKQAAMRRVFGFELLPAPFVISHLQLGLLLQSLGAPLAEDTKERVGVYLTNSLTGWEPPKDPKQHLVFPEMEAERDAAENVKQHAKILVVIGNPPYNGFAGVGMEEEHALTDAYRVTKRAPAPQGHGLNDLYVRFFRVAERKIVDGTGAGIVCLISNYSWLDRLSHTGMRERYLDVFDKISIDCLNGDSRATGKLTPEGQPDPSVFSTEQNPEGIQVGTAIALLVRRKVHHGTDTVLYRDFWGADKRRELLDSLNATTHGWVHLEPDPRSGLKFVHAPFGAEYIEWPLMTEVFATSFPGVKTSRDDFVVDMDRNLLEARLEKYLDPKIDHETISRLFPGVMGTMGGFSPEVARDYLRGQSVRSGQIARYAYRPFDVRWIYWNPDTTLLDRSRPEFMAQVFKRNLFIEARQREPLSHYSRGMVVSVLADNFANGLSNFFPQFLRQASLQPSVHTQTEGIEPNVSSGAIRYLESIGVDRSTWSCLFQHVVAINSTARYRNDNDVALRQNWPRLPLPGTKDALTRSASLGAQVVDLLNTEVDAANVTVGSIREELKVIGNITAAEGAALNPSCDLLVEAGWGHEGKEGITMPGKGKLIERDYTEAEREAIAQGAAALGLTPEQAFAQLGERTCDVYLNSRAYWKNIPAKVWDYYIGGYQVIKKWLSYREGKLLGRALTVEEARYVRDMARRIAALCLLQPQLDANYAAVKANTYPWPRAE